MDNYGVKKSEQKNVIAEFLEERKRSTNRIKLYNRLPSFGAVGVDDIDFNCVFSFKYIGDLLYLISSDVDSAMLKRFRAVLMNDWDNFAN